MKTLRRAVLPKWLVTHPSSKMDACIFLINHTLIFFGLFSAFLTPSVFAKVFAAFVNSTGLADTKQTAGWGERPAFTVMIVLAWDFAATYGRYDYRDIYSDMLKGLKIKGAKIGLVTFPASPDFQAALKSVNDVERAEILSFFQNQAKSFGALYVDWEDATDELSNFRDTDHLNGEAAKRLSPELMDLCFG